MILKSLETPNPTKLLIVQEILKIFLKKTTLDFKVLLLLFKVSVNLGGNFMDASILNYTVNDNVGEFLSKDKKLYINGKMGRPIIWEII